MRSIDVSVVVGVYNEAGNIRPLIEQISRALASIRYEIIYVNDGSTDATLTELRSVTHERLMVLDLQRNYGQSSALAAGIDAAQGASIVTMDGDGQNDPADIVPMLRVMQDQDVDLVMGIRQNRQDGLWLRKLPSRLANALVRKVLGLRIQDNGCGIKLFRAELAKRIGLYGEMHRFVAILAHIEGARIVQVPVRHHPRRIGQSKYGLSRTFRVLSDLVLLFFLKNYRQKPMHLFGGMGFALMALGAGLSVSRLLGLLNAPEAGVCLLGGLQFLGLGILAEMQLRTHYESQGKKPYRVRRVFSASAPSVSVGSTNRDATNQPVAVPADAPNAGVWTDQ